MPRHGLGAHSNAATRHAEEVGRPGLGVGQAQESEAPSGIPWVEDLNVHERRADTI